MMEFLGSFSLLQFAVLLGGAFTAGVLNAISGGGGMVLIPLMVLSGVPPINAIAINKFQNTVGSLAAIVHYREKGLSGLHNAKFIVLLASIGAVIGVLILKTLSESDLLLSILPYLLIAIALYSVLPTGVQTTSFRGRGDAQVFVPMWGFVGLYGGLIGLGTGPLMIAVDRFVSGCELRQAIARTKPIMFATNVVSLSALIIMGFLWWKIAVLLALANVVGAKLGACIVTGSMLKLAQAIVFFVPIAAAIRLLLASN